MNRREFTLALALGTAIVVGIPAAADEVRLNVLLALRMMTQQVLTDLEVNRKALIEQIAKLDAEIERERKN